MTIPRARPARREEAREHPLDSILGTGAAVRVLRSLHGGEQLAPPYIARSTRLSRPAVRDALIRLERAGIVERVGQGRSVLYRMASDHPLYRRIVKLFRAESRRAAARATPRRGGADSGATP